MQLPEVLQYTYNQEQLLPRFTPEVYIFETPAEVDMFTAARLIGQIQMKPNSVLTLPTGNN